MEEKATVEVAEKEGPKQPEKDKPEITEERQPKGEEPEERPKGESRTGIRVRGPSDRVNFLNILNHGDSGSGKTTFCGTMIKAGLKTLYVTFNEDELLTLDMMGLKDYDYYVITNYEKQLWPLYLGLRRNKPGYEGLIIDGLADFQQAAKDYELAGDEGYAKFMEEAIKGNRRMYLQNWGNLLEMTRHFLDPVLKLPLHKIVTCVSEADNDPKTGKTKIYPALQGSLQQLIAAHFSVVGFSYIAHWGDKSYFCLTTQPHEAISTKDRTGLCRVMIDPNFRTFLNILEGKPYPRGKKSELEGKLAKALVVRPQATRVTSSESSRGREKE